MREAEIRDYSDPFQWGDLELEEIQAQFGIWTWGFSGGLTSLPHVFLVFVQIEYSKMKKSTGLVNFDAGMQWILIWEASPIGRIELDKNLSILLTWCFLLFAAHFGQLQSSLLH